MYCHNASESVLYTKVAFIQSVLYQRFHCIWWSLIHDIVSGFISGFCLGGGQISGAKILGGHVYNKEKQANFLERGQKPPGPP